MAARDPWADLADVSVEIAGRSLELVRPRDTERLLDEERFGENEFIPYWAELWPSAVALARHIGTSELHETAVLELGCGLGLPSIAAALAGADVLATDWSPDALGFVEANARRNDVVLRTAILPWETRSPEVEPAALVLAADVLYEERNAMQLARLLPSIVAAEGSVVLADPGRRHAEAFFAALDSRWRCEQRDDVLLPRGGIYRLWKP